MREYYIFQSQGLANACVNEINAEPYFPFVGKVRGAPSPGTQQTLNWVADPKQMLSGEWAVPRVPVSVLEEMGVSEARRSSFLSLHGTDIRLLNSSDFDSEG